MTDAEVIRLTESPEFRWLGGINQFGLLLRRAEIEDAECRRASERDTDDVPLDENCEPI